MGPIDRHDLLATLRSLLGVPFRHQGRDRRYGVDCLGLDVLVCRTYGIPVEDARTYPEATDGVWLTRELQRQHIELPLAGARPGDLLQWRTPGTRVTPGTPCNVMFLVDGGSPYNVIHAMRDMGLVTEHGYSGTGWTRLVVAAYQLSADILPWNEEG